MPRITATLLVIDDEPLNLALLANLLKPHHRVLGARSGALALALLEQERPDLILLDVVMPEMDGLTLLVRLKQNPVTADIPVILVSALGDEVDEELGLALGAVDYIVKPIKPAVVLARVRTHLDLHEAQQRLQQHNAWLERTLAQRLHDHQLGQDVTLCALTELIETRGGDENSPHTLRTQRYVEAMASWLRTHPVYGVQLREPALSMLVKAAPLHDIGKIGIPDHILLKPAPLTAEEFEVMKTHTRIGGDALRHAIHRALALHGDRPSAHHPLPDGVRYLEVARLIATHHHECWDGSGYPDGLAERDIPLPARIVAVADVFDALTHRKPHRPAWPVEEAQAYVRAQAGQRFDPIVVAAFDAMQDRFTAIRAHLAD
ncbi:two-component system response regulator [Vitreoscilla filiformis]|uniref:Two-component system response regulator n=1 Tax=Vitreoscilla filiformis TaxID=63 RepID=A0A221K9Z5_VITFI|nr:HD domain-containing phosphohydrolase [Vitreoscilla filiformis]ASM75841.1 two-component system response regulator [Vitreoscilla filiformis]